MGYMLLFPPKLSIRTMDKGRSYYLGGKVGTIRQWDGARTGEHFFETEVRGSGDIEYTVYLQADGSGVTSDYSCDCPAFAEYAGPCKHIIAAIYRINNLELVERSGRLVGGSEKKMAQIEGPRNVRAVKRQVAEPVCKTDFAAVNCIYEYEHHSERLDAARGGGELREGKIQAVPKLIWDADACVVEITVGESRQYVVKSLQDFCVRMLAGRQLFFGKQFSFEGRLEAFDESSRQLVGMLVNRYREMADLERVKEGYNSLVDQLFTRGKRAMLLTPALLDELLSLYEGGERSVAVKREERAPWRQYGARFDEDRKAVYGEAGFDRLLCIKDHTPVVKIAVRKREGGMYFSAVETFLQMKGREHLYLNGEAEPDCLWRCERRFGDRVAGLLRTLEGGGFVVADKDLPRFCGGVLSAVEEFVELTGDVEELDRYTPAEMEARVYLDSPATDTITALIKGDYDGLLVNLYTNKIEYVAADKDGVPDLQRNQEVKERARRLVRNSKQENALHKCLEPYFMGLDPKQGEWYIKGDTNLLYDFLTRGQQEIAEKARVFVTERYRHLSLPVKTKMTVGVSLESDLLELTFDAEGFPREELLDMLKSYRSKKRYHRLKNGTFVSLEATELMEALALTEELGLTAQDLAAGRRSMPKYWAMHLDGAMEQGEGVQFERNAGFDNLMHEIKSIEESRLEVPASLEHIMRDYQKTGYRWLSTMSRLGFGGILADDMGLGKTLEVISLLVGEAEKAETAGTAEAAGTGILALVVCPASLMLNWEKELNRFAPQLIARPVLGTAGMRRDQICAMKEGAPEASRCVLITSYDLLKRDLALYEGIRFQYHIIDEAQYIKNFSTQNAKAVKGVESLHRFALTGTPVENRISELWSIFDFLMPGYLRSYWKFKEDYEIPILRDHDERKTVSLKKQTMPFILRRLKEKVLLELPPKQESVVCVPMEAEQRKLYLANLAKAKQEIGRDMREGKFEGNKIQVLALLTRLRQLCCHPALCYEEYSKGSGKLEACIELIREATAGGHRILLFSQFTSMLALIAERLKEEELEYYLLTGRTDKAERQRLVSRFNENGVPVFLISLKAGGTGLNLTGADIVIHYDPWWNQAVQNQATDRAHRMGQQRSVQVYKLVAEGTIEEKIIKLQEAKSKLADAIIDENNSLFSAADAQQIRELFE